MMLKTNIYFNNIINNCLTDVNSQAYQIIESIV
jgi:hypothetical protein